MTGGHPHPTDRGAAHSVPPQQWHFSLLGERNVTRDTCEECGGEIVFDPGAPALAEGSAQTAVGIELVTARGTPPT